MAQENLEGKIIVGQAGKYKITEPLGTGGFGEVWKAEAGKEIVAVKILLPEHYQNGSSLEQFLQEGKITLQLRHEHIIRTYEVGKDDQLGPYIVTEYLEGGSLNRYLQPDKVDTARARQIIVDVAEALDFAHGKGILHRDVHPGNILFDKNGKVILTDFGLAAVMKSSPIYASIISSTSQSKGAPVNPDDFLRQILAGVLRSHAVNRRDPVMEEAVRSCIGVQEYTAHEIFSSGKGIDAATKQSDQFSLSRVAHKLLVGLLKDERYVNILRISSAVEPTERYATMKAFIAAIQAVPDYLSLLRQKKGIASGKTFSKAELEEVCTLGEQGYKEEPTNKDALREVLEQIRSAQHDAYFPLVLEIEQLLQKEGKGISTARGGELMARIQPIKEDIMPLYHKIRTLVEQK